MRAKPYSEYNDSGIDWCPLIPSNWGISTVKRFAKFTTGWTPPSGNADYYGDDFYWANISDIGPKILIDTAKSVSKLAIDTFNIESSKPGDLLFSFKLSIGQVSLVGGEMYTNEAIATFKLSSEYDIKWAFYAFPVFIPKNAEDNIYGAPLLNQERIKNAKIFLPSPEDQKQIARFLDHETAKIDELILKQEDLIKTLNDRRVALIYEKTILGLNSSAKFIKANIQWINQIPAHWKILPLLAIAEENLQINKNLRENNLLSLSYGRIIRKDINSNKGLLPKSFETYQVVDKNFVVFRLTDLQNDKKSLRSAIVRERGIITSAYVAVMPNKINPEYFNYLMRAYDLTKVFYSMGGGLRQSIKFSDLKRLPVLIPPMVEQLKIVENLNHELSMQDNLIDKANQAIQLQKEHRETLIFEVITGKINIKKLA